MKLHTGFLSVVLFGAVGLSFAAVDENPVTSGTTVVRPAVGSSVDACLQNPAMLGVDAINGERIPSGGLLLDAGGALWSDKLWLNPFDLSSWANADSTKAAQLLSKLFARSFNITDADMSDTTGLAVSKKLTDGFKGGLKVYGGSRATLFAGAFGRCALDITTHMEDGLQVPEGPFDLLFSNDKGLLRGNSLDFSNFKQTGIWATDITFSVGLPVTIPALQNLFNLRYGAGGVGVKYIMGHDYFSAQTTSGTVTYLTGTNQVAVNGEAKIQEAGNMMSGNFDFENPFKNGMQVNGHGFGLDMGGILYDDHASVSINLQNLGVIFWLNNTKSADYKIQKNNLDFYSILNGFKVAGYNGPQAALGIFNRDSNEYLSDASDSLKTSSGFTTTLPATVDFGYAYRWNFKEKSQSPAFHTFSQFASYAVASANYQQSFTENPGYSYIPRVAIGGELGVAQGIVPFRMGFVGGGAEEMASSLGIGLNLDQFMLQVSYKAVGSLYFCPTHGMELAAGINCNWGAKPPPRKPLPPPRPVHDTIALRDTISNIKMDTLVLRDTLRLRDTVVQLRLRPSASEEQALVKELKGVNFQTASAELLPSSYTHLGSVAAFLRKYAYLRYEVQGHTDSRGDAQYNLMLSAARAASVRKYLLSQAIPDSSLVAIGYGLTKPIAPNTTAQGRALNRRVQFEVINSNEEYQRLRALEADFKERINTTDFSKYKKTGATGAAIHHGKKKAATGQGTMSKKSKVSKTSKKTIKPTKRYY